MKVFDVTLIFIKGCSFGCVCTFNRKSQAKAYAIEQAKLNGFNERVKKAEIVELAV